MKITTQLRITIVGILMLATSSIATTFFTTTGQEGTVVNQAGLVRGASQRLVKLELKNQPNDELMNRLDKIVNGLINGDKDLNLPPAYKELLPQMKLVESEWKSLKFMIQRARKDPNLQPQLLNQSESFFKVTDKSVGIAEEVSKNKTQRLKDTQLIIFFLNMLTLGAIWLIIHNITGTLQSFVSNIGSTLNEVTQSVAQQQNAVSLQANSVNETTVTIEELGMSSLESATQAEAASGGAQQALNFAAEGTVTVGYTIEGIAELKDQVMAIAHQIVRLSEQTTQITTVSSLVADLASQTNMLALNAGVEAARAGEQGKGFAVVAGEIRKLADQSRKSADRINILVNEVQAAINSTIMVTDEGTKKATEGIKLAGATGDVFTSIANDLNHVFLKNQQIAMTAKQQAVAVQQVVSAMNALNLEAQETASEIAQVKNSTQSLNETAQKLLATV